MHRPKWAVFEQSEAGCSYLYDWRLTGFLNTGNKQNTVQYHTVHKALKPLSAFMRKIFPYLVGSDCFHPLLGWLRLLCPATLMAQISLPATLMAQISLNLYCDCSRANVRLFRVAQAASIPYFDGSDWFSMIAVNSYRAQLRHVGKRGVRCGVGPWGFRLRVRRSIDAKGLFFAYRGVSTLRL